VPSYYRVFLRQTSTGSGALQISVGSANARRAGLCFPKVKAATEKEVTFGGRL